MGRSPWLWSLSSFLAAAGLQVSGFTNHYIGYSLMVVSGLLAIYAILRKKPQGSSKVGKVTVGNESVVMGDVSGTVGDKSVVIGQTSGNGNTILNQAPLAVGHGAKAGPGSIAIGVNAGAGLSNPEPDPK